MKHSPGPWFWTEGRTMLFYRGSDEDKAKLRASGMGPGAGDKMGILTCGDEGGWAPDEADAALISKAPEMLEMLRELEPACKEACDESGPWPKPDLMRRLNLLLRELP